MTRISDQSLAALQDIIEKKKGTRDRKKRKMAVSGKNVLKLKDIIIKKSRQLNQRYH